MKQNKGVNSKFLETILAIRDITKVAPISYQVSNNSSDKKAIRNMTPGELIDEWNKLTDDL